MCETLTLAFAETPFPRLLDSDFPASLDFLFFRIAGFYLFRIAGFHFFRIAGFYKSSDAGFYFFRFAGFYKSSDAGLYFFSIAGFGLNLQIINSNLHPVLGFPGFPGNELHKKFYANPRNLLSIYVYGFCSCTN